MNRRALRQSALVLGMGLRQDEQAAVRPKEGDVLVKADDAAKTPLAPGEIPLGAKHTLAWAMDPADKTVRSGSRLNQLLLVRLAPETLSPETAPRAGGGGVAYTAICTHNGCDIDDWLAAEQLLSCSCHSSSFDPKKGGRVAHGPPPRALPAPPLRSLDA